MKTIALTIIAGLMLVAGCQVDVAGQVAAPSPDNVNAAVKAGQRALLARQRPDGSWVDNAEGFPGGPSALAAWALLECCNSPEEPKMVSALAYLQGLRTDKTYTVAIRANVWAAAERLQPGRFGNDLRVDTERLFRHSIRGAYSYVTTQGCSDITDQSNSHYGVLGVQAAIGSKVAIPREYWQDVRKYWLDMQNVDGGWPYSRKGTPTSATMTVAGIATLQLCQEQLGAAGSVPKTADPALAAAIGRGLAWVDANFQATLKDPQVLYYYFLSIDRLGRTSGRTQLGGVDWKAAVTAELIRRQNPDGTWDGPWGKDVSTAYALLVLARK